MPASSADRRRLGEVPERRRAQPREHPGQVGLVDDLPRRRGRSPPRARGEARPEPTVTLGLHERLHGLATVGRQHVDDALAVGRHEGVEVDELGDPLGHPVGDAGDDVAGRAVPDQQHAVEVLVAHEVDDVGDVRRHPDLRGRQVGPLAETGQGRRVDLVALRAQQRRRPSSSTNPRTTPGARGRTWPSQRPPRQAPNGPRRPAATTDTTTRAATERDGYFGTATRSIAARRSAVGLSGRCGRSRLPGSRRRGTRTSRRATASTRWITSCAMRSPRWIS